MNNIWFTSDHHFGHKNIIKYCNRPFSSVDEMDAVLTEKWNKQVKDNDIVYYLGDFTLGSFSVFVGYFKNLHGKFGFIEGSHDRWIKEARSKMFYDPRTLFLPCMHHENFCGYDFTLCHYAMRSWPISHYGSYHLYGHHHGNLPGYGYSMDVSVDTNDFNLYHLDEIIDIMKKKTDIPYTIYKTN